MKIYVKEVATSKVVKEIDVTGKSERNCERVLRGLLMQMNREDYYVDDSEVDAHFDEEPPDA